MDDSLLMKVVQALGHLTKVEAGHVLGKRAQCSKQQAQVSAGHVFHYLLEKRDVRL